MLTTPQTLLDMLNCLMTEVSATPTARKDITAHWLRKIIACTEKRNGANFSREYGEEMVKIFGRRLVYESYVVIPMFAVNGLLIIKEDPYTGYVKNYYLKR